MTFTNNHDLSRFEYHVGEYFVTATYRIVGQILYIDYVEAPPVLRGTGAATKIMEEILAYARENELEIVPVCGYAASWLRRNNL